MKKVLSVITLSCAVTVLTSPLAVADVTPLFSFYAGAGSWASEYKGDIGEANATAEFETLGFDDEDNMYFYAAFEHPVPLVPNVRLELSDLSSSGVGDLTDNFSLGNQSWSAGTEIASRFDMTFTDLTLYYEILMFDFGLTARQFDIEMAAEQVSDTDNSAVESFDGVLPLIYLQTKVSLPFSGVYFTGAGNFVSYDDKSLADLRAALGYDLELGPLATLGIELGYRMFELDLGEDEDLSGVVELSGPYLGLGLEF